MEKRSPTTLRVGTPDEEWAKLAESRARRIEELQQVLHRIAYGPCGVFTKDEAVRHYSRLAREALGYVG